MTRGSEKALFIEVDKINADTTVTVDLIKNTETYTTPAKYRASAKLPADNFDLRVRDYWKREAAHTMHVDRHTDRVSLRVVKLETSMDQSFQFTDNTETDRGDYYYLRVRQMDGGQAWSSPIWVGATFAK